jgi:hypothetical protein
VTDPGFLYVTLGVVVGNFLQGHPIWLMLVGPSGCGKTQMLNAAAESVPPWFRTLSDASRASFLSGASKRDRVADATGGLLMELAANDIRFIVFKEYGSILDQRKEDYVSISAMQREIWDGSISRPVGSDGGKVLEWSGKVGELAGCTNRIDDVLADETNKGVRWLLWRYPRSTGWQEALKAGEQTDPEEMRVCLSSAVATVLVEANLEWNMESRRLSNRESTRINRIASFSAKLQGSMARDKYQANEMTNSPSEAYPTRLGPALVRIYLGMERIGVEEEERWKQIRKVALDTAPALRVAILREFVQKRYSREFKDDWDSFAEDVRCGRQTVLQTLEDLAMLGILERERGSHGWRYYVPQDTEEEMKC